MYHRAVNRVRRAEMASHSLVRIMDFDETWNV